MDTLPPLEREEKTAGLACPDCAGTLAVRVDGSSGHLRFRCRIGHAYALASLLAAKEESLEYRLWSAVVSLEELAALLEELQALGPPYTAGAEWEAATERIARLRAGAAAVRSVIDRNDRMDLGPAGAFEEDAEPC